jgi:hypothetical protein
MSAPISATAARPQAQRSAAQTVHSERLFYVIAGGVMLLATAIGFREFYLHGKGFAGDITRQIVPLVVAHGLAMFSWVVLFFVQSLLILNGNRRLHMRIGVAGALLAGSMVILGSTTAILSTRNNPEAYQILGGTRFFLATLLGEMLCFGTLVGMAIISRRRAEIHRPMMLLASLMIISASLGRSPYIQDFSIKPPLYVMGPPLVLGALFLVLQWGMTRALNRWFAIGYLGLAAASILFVAIGHTHWWNQIAAALVG